MSALKLEDIKERLTQDIGAKDKDKDKDKEEKESKINSLPEYTIRTMKDDIAEVSLGQLEQEAETAEGKQKIVSASGPNLEEEVPELKKSTLPSTEELIKKESEEEKLKPDAGEKPTKSVSFATPPVDLPIREEREEEKLEAEPIPVPTPPKEPTQAKIMTESIRRKVPRFVIFGIVGLIIVLAVGGFFYWQGTRPEPEPEPMPELGPKLSPDLISIEETKKPLLSNYSNLSELLRQEVEISQTDGTFKRIGVLRNEQEFLSLPNLFQNLGIAIPPYSLAQLGDEYNLVIYSQKGLEGRLGIIIEVKNVIALKEQLKFWEETMANDLNNLFLGKRISDPATPTFQNNTYRGNDIRYINFPEPELTIDYTIINNLFVLATSRESMYRIIDRIVDNL